MTTTRLPPQMLTDEENKALLTEAEYLWKRLVENDLGGFSDGNRPFYIFDMFEKVIETYGNRDVGQTWSKIELDALPEQVTMDSIEKREREAGVPFNESTTYLNRKSRSTEHGEQPASGENWNGERRARHWQAKAERLDYALKAIQTYWRSKETITDFEMEVLISQAEELINFSSEDGAISVVGALRDAQQHDRLRWHSRTCGKMTTLEHAQDFFMQAVDLFRTIVHHVAYNDGNTTLDEQYRVLEMAKANALTTLRLRCALPARSSVKRELGCVGISASVLAQALGASLHQEEEREFNRLLSSPPSK